jgi:hypothetical protein
MHASGWVGGVTQVMQSAQFMGWPSHLLRTNSVIMDLEWPLCLRQLLSHQHTHAF